MVRDARWISLLGIGIALCAGLVFQQHNIAEMTIMSVEEWSMRWAKVPPVETPGVALWATVVVAVLGYGFVVRALGRSVVLHGGAFALVAVLLIELDPLAREQDAGVVMLVVGALLAGAGGWWAWRISGLSWWHYPLGLGCALLARMSWQASTAAVVCLAMLVITAAATRELWLWPIALAVTLAAGRTGGAWALPDGEMVLALAVPLTAAAIYRWYLPEPGRGAYARWLPPALIATALCWGYLLRPANPARLGGEAQTARLTSAFADARYELRLVALTVSPWLTVAALALLACAGWQLLQAGGGKQPGGGS